MDNYEYNIKSDQIKKLYSKKDYSTAAKVADSIDWRRVKNNSMINLVADIYDRCKEYEKARDVLLIAYSRTTCGRQLAYKLTILSLRLKDFVGADEFYNDFVGMAPDDTTQYILKYRIAKTKGEDNDVLIQILEAYADVEMDERWQYELAKLYALTDQREKCIAMCDQIILWFSEGKYVEKAMELKMKYEPLTTEQQEKYENRQEWQESRESRIEDTPAAVPVAESDVKADEIKITISQKKMEDKTEGENVAQKENNLSENAPLEFQTDHLETAEIHQLTHQHTEDMKQLDKEMYGNNNTIEFYDFTDVTKEKMSKIDEDLMKTAEIDIDEINFRAMNISEYDTANIQAAIAKSMEIIMKESRPQEVKEGGTGNTAPMAQATKRLDTSELSPNARSPFVQKEEDDALEAFKKEAKISIMKEHLQREREENQNAKKSIYSTVPLSPLFEQEEDGQIGLAEVDKQEEQIVGQMTIEEVLHEYEIRAKYEAALAEVAKYEAEIKKQEERRKAREAAFIIENSLPEQPAEIVELTGQSTGDADSAEQSIDEQQDLIDAMFGKLEDNPLEKETAEEEENREDVQPAVVSAQMAGEFPSFEIKVNESPAEEVPYTSEPDMENPSGQEETADEQEVENLSGQEETTGEQEADILSGQEETASEQEADILSGQEETTGEQEADIPSGQEETTGEQEADTPSGQEESTSETSEHLPEQEKTVIQQSTAQETASKKSQTESSVSRAEEEKAGNRDEEELKKIHLNEEYRAVFADFLDVPGLEEQLVTTIDHLINDFVMDGASKTNNVLVMGDTKVGKTTLALGIIKVANRGRGNGRSARKVAKIKAEVLNKKGVTSAMPKILGTDLIIEKAGNLTPVTVTDLIAIMKTYTEEMLIVLEDDQAAIERLANTNPEIREVFTNEVYIKGYDPDDYVRMAKDYAAKRRYIISEMGTLALYARIGDIFSRNQCVTKDELEEIIDEAIEKSEHGGIKKLLGRMKRNRDEFLVLKEEDFV